MVLNEVEKTLINIKNPKENNNQDLITIEPYNTAFIEVISQFTKKIRGKIKIKKITSIVNIEDLDNPKSKLLLDSFRSTLINTFQKEVIEKINRIILKTNIYDKERLTLPNSSTHHTQILKEWQKSLLNVRDTFNGMDKKKLCLSIKNNYLLADLNKVIRELK